MNSRVPLFAHRTRLNSVIKKFFFPFPVFIAHARATMKFSRLCQNWSLLFYDDMFDDSKLESLELADPTLFLRAHSTHLGARLFRGDTDSAGSRINVVKFYGRASSAETDSVVRRKPIEAGT